MTSMTYERWRDELFNHPPETDPVELDHSQEFYEVPSVQAFDYVDRVLLDEEAHALFTKEQLGIGINTIYSNCCSDLPFLYTTDCDEPRRLVGTQNLVHLYRNYFERYCTASVGSIGNDHLDGRMGFICYMFWDVFVLYHGNASPAMTSAAIGVMSEALRSHNDNCLVSAIHGLGHWALDVPEAASVLKQWLRKPTTLNPEVIEYARAATTGMIL